jgi:hypothetical protein
MEREDGQGDCTGWKGRINDLINLVQFKGI